MSDTYPYYDSIAHKRYRMIGNTREYESTLLTSKGSYPTSFEIRSEREAPEEKTEKDCPFKRGLVFKCSSECVFRSGEECSLKDREKAFRLKEGRCPVSNRMCLNECAMRENGHCKLFER